MTIFLVKKPDRNLCPAFPRQGEVGAIIAVVFGVIWTGMTSSMGAPPLFPLFGVLFILIGIGQAVYHFINAAGKNRFSVYDITDSSEEPDPLQERIGHADRGDGRAGRFERKGKLLPLLRRGGWRGP